MPMDSMNDLTASRGTPRRSQAVGSRGHGRPPMFLAMLLSICVLLLQAGLTYYISFQSLAVLLIFWVMLNGRPKVLNPAQIFLVMLMFSVFLILTARNVPAAISENSENMLNTSLGVVGYAAMILLLANLGFRAPRKVLRLFGAAASLVIVEIAALILLTDLAIVPFLTRENLILQNTTLITNYTTLDVLAENFAYLQENGLKPNIDMFYGEQSFLAVVIFACLMCRMVCDKVLKDEPPSLKGRRAWWGKINDGRLMIALSLALMIYIQAFSAMFYVVVICISLLLSNWRRMVRVKLGPKSMFIVVLVFALLVRVAMSAFDYYMHRVTTVSDSVSFDQRFGSVFDFGWQEYIFGIDDAIKIPRTGFQNGVLYIIAISGFGGISLLLFLAFRVHVLARPHGLSIIALFCVLGIFSQNGGILSPNKVVILSFVLVPLACAWRLRTRPGGVADGASFPRSVGTSS